MQTAKCEKCGRETQINDAYKLDNITLCKECGEKIITEQKNANIESQTDPTICIKCGKDNGSMALPLLAGLPVCHDCEEFYRHRPFPMWVKAFLLGVLAVTALVFVWNYRFFQGYIETKNSFRYFVSGDIEKAKEQMDSAVKHVPEDSELAGMAGFYKGVSAIQQEKYTEALEAFQSCRSSLKSEEWAEILNGFTLSAQIGAAFDSNDYDKLLELSLEKYNKTPEDGQDCAQVASAYACKYAVTGDEQFKTKSLEMLDKSRTLTGDIEFFREYEQRILHRLYSREIITRKEFNKRFPNGWKEPQKE